MEEFITDKRTGLRYELVGDYYLIAGEDEPEGRPIGIWGQRHLRYIRKHKVGLYAELLTTGKLNDYLADLNEQAEAMFSRLVKQLSEKEGVTEALKSENQMLWVQKMNNLRNALWKSFQAGLSIADIKQGKSLPQTAAFPVRVVFKKS